MKNLKEFIKKEIKKLQEQNLLDGEPMNPQMLSGCCDPNALNYNPGLVGQQCDNCACVMMVNGAPVTGNNYPGNSGCPGMPAAYSGPTTTQACIPNDWPNYTNWTNNFSNIVSNANNPCVFLQNKLNTWMAASATAGTNQANQLACKIKYVQQILQPQYGCTF